MGMRAHRGRIADANGAGSAEDRRETVVCSPLPSAEKRRRKKSPAVDELEEFKFTQTALGFE
jgi:hypothetical protein